jgi:Ca-activated chloride channel family protein
MELFRFANPGNLYLLLAVPVVVAVWIYRRSLSKKLIRRLGQESLVTQLMPERSVSRPLLKHLLLIISYSMLVVATARPQYGARMEEVKKEGVEVIIALDVSNSMLATDIRPDRLERSKQAIERMVEVLENDRIGLVVFAGDAYIQLPLTADYTSAKMFLSAIGPDIVPKQGTAIGAAIDLGIRSFSPQNTESRAMIIITDGENHEDDPISAAEAAKQAGVTIYTIGIGSPEGAPIPLNAGGRTEFLKDRDGNTVITKLDEKVLQEIASSTGGKYIRATASGLGLNEIYADIGKMKKGDTGGKVFTEYNDQFQYFAGAAFLLLLIEYLIMERKNRKLRSLRLLRIKL